VKTSLVLSVRSLSKTYRIGLRGCTVYARALDEVHLDVAHGEVVAVVGPPNAGKTTLLRCIAGLLVPDEGTIGRHVAADERALAVGYLEGPIELSRLRSTREVWDVTLVDNLDDVSGDVGAAFALLTAAREVPQRGAIIMAARDPRVVGNVASRIVRLQHGRLQPPTVTAQLPIVARVAETSVRP
jgi:ABC-type glutathione transport system ATPase component